MASLQSAKSTTVTLATTPELERQERIAYTAVQELMRMPDPAHFSYMKDAIPSRNIPELRAVRVVGFDVYDTLIKVGFLRHVAQGTRASSDLEAIKKAIAYSGLTRDELRIEPEHIPELLAALERQAKVPFKVGSETIYPEMDIISNWSKVLGVDDVARLVRVSTAFEAMRAQYSIMPGADTFLSVLKESGLRIGVISNSQVYTPAILDQMFIRENGTPVRNYFSDPSLMIYSHRTNLESHRVMKPSRALF